MTYQIPQISYQLLVELYQQLFKFGFRIKYSLRIILSISLMNNFFPNHRT